MKHINKFIITTLIICLVMSNNILVHASDSKEKDPCVNYSITVENDRTLNNATVISSNRYIKNSRAITKTVYRQPDGTIVTDIINVSAISVFSKNGSDTATRTRSISGWGSITITASFSWRTKGAFSYVKCTSMSASHKLNSKVKVSKWDTSYTKKEVKLGKAKAQVDYSLYNSKVKFQYQKGTFKITCSDSGTISDNN